MAEVNTGNSIDTIRQELLDEKSVADIVAQPDVALVLDESLLLGMLAVNHWGWVLLAVLANQSSNLSLPARRMDNPEEVLAVASTSQ